MWQRHLPLHSDPTMQIRDEDLQRILDAARWAPTAHNMQNFEVIVVDDQRRLSAIRAIQMAPMETFIRETHHQLSMSEAELLRRKTGLLASMFPRSHGMKRRPIRSTVPRRTIPSWAAPSKSAPCCWLSSTTAATGTPAPASGTPAPRGYGAPASRGYGASGLDGRLREEAVLSLMSLGCVMQNIWLMTESLGISMQVLSGLGAAAVESQVRSVYNGQSRSI